METTHTYGPGSVKNLFHEIINKFGFFLHPGSRVPELTKRQFDYEKIRSKRKFILRLKSPLTILGIIIILFIATLAVFAPWISPYTADELKGLYANPWAPPSPDHLLGTTKLGRDILGRLIFGARTSLTIALPSLGFSVVFGVISGMIAAYSGGKLDAVIMRVMDVLIAFPSLIFALLVVAILGHEVQPIMIIYGILGVPFYSRLIRGSVLQAKNLSYVDAARVSGASNWRIMFRHILPNTITPVLIYFTFEIGGVILSLAALGFLGVVDPSIIEWGQDVSNGREFLYSAPWASIWPGIMIAITVLGFMLLGDGLRDAFDPRLKNL